MAFTLRLKPDLADALEQAAKARGMRRSDLIAKILIGWVERDRDVDRLKRTLAREENVIQIDPWSRKAE